MNSKNWKGLRLLGVRFYDLVTHGWYDFPDNFSLEAFWAGTLTPQLKMVGSPVEDTPPEQMPTVKKSHVVPNQLSLF